MAAKRIFYVTSTDLTAVYCDRGQVKLIGKFDLTDEGVGAFADFLKQDPDHPSAFIVDVIEEEFRIENIPHVGGADRDRLLERKAAALFHAATFTSAQVIGREHQGRRDDRVLFTALNKTDMLERWLNAVQEAKVPLAGVYSVAMLTGLLIRKFKIRHVNTLVLSIQNGRLLRQSFFSKGKLKLSRLTPLVIQDCDSFLKNILAEVERNKRYLGRLQLLDFKVPLEVYILTEGEQMQTLQAGCVNGAQINYHFLDLNKVAAKLGLKQAIGADECEWCFANMLNRKLPLGNYVPQKKQAYYNLFRLRRMMVAASIFLATVATFWGGADIYAGQNLALKASQTEAATRHVAEQLLIENNVDLNSSSYSPHTMRAVVEADQLLTKHKPSPLGILPYIGECLAKHSNIELDQVSWGTAQSNSGGETYEQENTIGTAVETAKVIGHLKVFPGNYQAAFQQVEALLETIRRNNDIASAEALSLPLNADPSSSLVGESRRNVKALPASFELEIKLKEPGYEI